MVSEVVVAVFDACVTFTGSNIAAADGGVGALGG